MVLDGRRRLWDECVKQDLKVCGLSEAGTQDRVSWRSSVKNSWQEPTPSNGGSPQSMAASPAGRVLGMRICSFNKTGFDDWWLFHFTVYLWNHWVFFIRTGWHYLWWLSFHCTVYLARKYWPYRLLQTQQGLSPFMNTDWCFQRIFVSCNETIGLHHIFASCILQMASFWLIYQTGDD